MTSISGSSCRRRNSPTAFSIHHLLRSNESAGEDCCHQSDSVAVSEAANDPDQVKTPACGGSEVIRKVNGPDSDLVHILEESFSHRAVECDADRLGDVLRMLSSFIANLSRLHQNVAPTQVLSARQPPGPLALAQKSAIFPVTPASTEDDRFAYGSDPDQSASLENGITGGALSSLINMTFSKMLTLAEAKTLKGKQELFFKLFSTQLSDSFVLSNMHLIEA
ncbi:unnamed protein product [Schistocephalus solidus]|uniref:Uncharacterized protein n=1 Tax=Schistocephalus solidus TaxID=70667 RepID=A0A183SLL4_SCHSO|nr:unnamed protein product [Schistocephalus solidus]